jgi:MOSC domain-containing protein YiiM
MRGNLVGIARACVLGAPLEELTGTAISVERGIEGDARGQKRGRQVTVLFRDGWEDACRDVGTDLPWTTRRANLLLANMERPQEAGGVLRIGDAEFLITMETRPCELMERSYTGLRAALRPEWRGGVCCVVRRGGEIKLGEHAEYLPR